MTSLNKALTHLGFKSDVDYELQNDADDRGDYIRKWYSDDPQPTQEAIDQAKIDWQAEYDAQAYARARAEAYPSWREQMDMMFHDQTEGSRTWLDAIEAVKEAYPK